MVGVRGSRCWCAESFSYQPQIMLYMFFDLSMGEGCDGERRKWGGGMEWKKKKNYENCGPLLSSLPFDA